MHGKDIPIFSTRNLRLARACKTPNQPSKASSRDAGDRKIIAPSSTPACSPATPFAAPTERPNQVEVREEAARALALFASKRDSQAHLVRSGVVPKLVSFVRSSDPGVRRYGVLGLGNLAVVTQNHQTLFEAGGVSSLLMEAVYAAEDLETRRCVAFALNNITSFEPNHRACERAGVLRPLVRLLKDPDVSTHLQAVFAIRQLSVTARCRSQLVEMKGLPPLLRRELSGVGRWRDAGGGREG